MNRRFIDLRLRLIWRRRQRSLTSRRGCIPAPTPDDPAPATDVSCAAPAVSLSRRHEYTWSPSHELRVCKIREVLHTPCALRLARTACGRPPDLHRRKEGRRGVAVACCVTPKARSSHGLFRRTIAEKDPRFFGPQHWRQEGRKKSHKQRPVARASKVVGSAIRFTRWYPRSSTSCHDYH